MNNHRLWQSQNFLKRPELVASLLNKTDITKNDLVVEIGPGKGTITAELANRAGEVIAIEIDKKLIANLQKLFQGSSNIKIVEADFLKWQLPPRPYKVFSNIPFNLTADIIRKLTSNENPPLAAYLIMQDKAAFRFLGRPKESQISILLKPRFEAKILANIDKREFAPVPKVNAVLVEMKKRNKSLIEPQFEQWFRDFVVYGFNQWQPTILEALKNVFSHKQRAILEKEMGIKKAKPSDLSFNQWLKLFKEFISLMPLEKKDLVKGAEEELEKQQQKLEKWHRTR